ncbi:hypothetical protein HDV05_004848 [Chytridiales sp. JEL 0842]|nr:hypothetical protein HDV05_004848 [Chytridiales sp. JEL 0842]
MSTSIGTTDSPQSLPSYPNHESRRHRSKRHPKLAVVAQMALERNKKRLEMKAKQSKANALKDGAMYRAEREVTLHHMKNLMAIFEGASEGGKKAMTMEEFSKAFGKVLGLTEAQISLLFMQIDANTDNTVDWDEFSTFMLLRAERQSKMLEEASLHPFDLPPPLAPIPKIQTPHRESIVNIIFLPALKKYVTCSREGTVCYWSDSLKMQRCFINVGSKAHTSKESLEGNHQKDQERCSRLSIKQSRNQVTRWMHDVVYMKNLSKIAMSSDDHEISLYDYIQAIRKITYLLVTSEFSTLEPILRLDLHDSIAISMDFWYDEENPDSDHSLLLYGTDDGYIVMLNFSNEMVINNKSRTKGECPLLSMESFKSGKNGQTGLVKRKAHGDWVTKVRYYHDLHAIISCSTDPAASLCVATRDGKNKWNYFSASVHKGVNVFAMSKFPVALITGGTDHQLRLWNPHRLQNPMAALKGHNAPVVDITVNQSHGQVISLSTDNVIKIWDIRKHQCVQSIADTSLSMKSENGLNAIHFSSELDGQLVVASNVLTKYKQKSNTNELAITTAKSHDHPLKAALFNESFKQIVTGCDGGVINVWDAETGVKTFRFADAHGKAEITAMTFDSRNRRLITGGRDGSIYMWNFHNGQMLRELVKQDDSEVTSLLYIDLNDAQYVVATGWNRKVTMFPDSLDSVKIYPCATYEVDIDQTPWHKDDITGMAFCKPHMLVTASYDGEMVVSNLHSGHIIHRLHWPGAFDERNKTDRSIDKVLILEKRINTPQAASLIATGADGIVRWWRLSDGELIWEMDMTNGRQDGVYSLACTPSNDLLVSGDSAGWITVMDISETCLDDSEYVTPPKIVSHFRGHVRCIMSVEFIGTNSIVTSSVDGTARLFTIHGEYIGTLGQENMWDLSSPDTYAHPAKPMDVVVTQTREKALNNFRNVTNKVIEQLRENDDDSDKGELEDDIGSDDYGQDNFELEQDAEEREKEDQSQSESTEKSVASSGTQKMDALGMAVTVNLSNKQNLKHLKEKKSAGTSNRATPHGKLKKVKGGKTSSHPPAAITFPKAENAQSVDNSGFSTHCGSSTATSAASSLSDLTSQRSFGLNPLQFNGRRDIHTPELLQKSYRTWYSKSQHATNVAKHVVKSSGTLPKVKDYQHGRTYHTLVPRDLDSVLEANNTILPPIISNSSKLAKPPLVPPGSRGAVCLTAKPSQYYTQPVYPRSLIDRYLTEPKSPERKQALIDYIFG